jgi:hypothetical protein
MLATATSYTFYDDDEYICATSTTANSDTASTDASFYYPSGECYATYDYGPIPDCSEEELKILFSWEINHAILKKMWHESIKWRNNNLYSAYIPKRYYRRILRCNRHGLGLRIRKQ